ncbi:hypothetical protein THER5_1897 [Bifidobacterium thermacidophilum subsp. thermacidophilum]|uniref:Uncharacterized protein n=1 Tax=Bifidobacterium thermacidophilum subsp. thermacidophilum TaxID=79262 RepID=A0A087E254_9BIFI|nr:hypothetical protein THER5_1897 [Bifidobacterium thermacidophilum subsp. thermacidophilum]
MTPPIYRDSCMSGSSRHSTQLRLERNSMMSNRIDSIRPASHCSSNHLMHTIDGTMFHVKHSDSAIPQPASFERLSTASVYHLERVYQNRITPALHP